MKPIRVDRQTAARFLLAKQGLLETEGLQLWRDELAGAEGTLAAVSRLECVQIDPVSLVERNHHLVLFNRVGGYDPSHLDALLASGRVFEHLANARCFLPVEEYPVFWWRMRHYAKEQESRRRKLKGVSERIVGEIRATGARTSRSIESEEKVLGYWDQDTPKTKATSLALELLWESGDLMITGRNGNEKLYDLPERVVPAALRRAAAKMPEDEARRLLFEKYCRGYRLFDTGDFRFGWRRIPAAERRDLVARQVADGKMVPVEIEDVRRKYYVLSDDALLLNDLAGRGLEVAPHVFLLSPLDNLLWRRERLIDVFGFDYTWEIYLPPAKRRYGPYTMPILRGDRLVGRVDSHLDRTKGVLVVEGLWLDDGIGLAGAIEDALSRLAHFSGARELEIRSRPTQSV